MKAKLLIVVIVIVLLFVAVVPAMAQPDKKCHETSWGWSCIDPGRGQDTHFKCYRDPVYPQLCNVNYPR